MARYCENGGTLNCPRGQRTSWARPLFLVKAEAVAAVVTDLTEVSFEPSTRNVVVGQGSAVLKVLFFVVLDLFRQVVVQNNFVVLG